MGKTLIIFGLYETLMSFDLKVHSISPDYTVVPRRKSDVFFQQLRQLQEEKGEIDFFIATKLEPAIVEAFLNKSRSNDIFNQNLDLRFKRDFISSKVYDDTLNGLLGFEPRRVIEIEGYDKIILIDSEKRRKFDFLKLKMYLLMYKKYTNRYRGKVFGYINSRKSFSKIYTHLHSFLQKEEGVYLK